MTWKRTAVGGGDAIMNRKNERKWEYPELHIRCEQGKPYSNIF